MVVLVLRIAITLLNSEVSGPKSVPVSDAACSINRIKCFGSRSILRGSIREVIVVCPGARIGFLCRSASMTPKYMPLYEALALTLSRLILAVNGLANWNFARAIDV